MKSDSNDGIHVIPVRGMPEVSPKDDIAEMIASSIDLADGDVVVVTQKIVSKAENRLVDIDPEVGHKPIVENESVKILRRRGDLIISEDGKGHDRLIGIRPNGKTYILGENIYNKSIHIRN